MDLSAAIERIQKATAEAVRPSMHLPIVGEKDVYHLFNPHDGSLVTVAARPGPTSGRALTLTGLVQAVNRYREEYPGAVVWCGSRGVVAVLNDKDRRNNIAMQLTCSQAFAALMDWENHLRAQSQKQLIWLLRTTMARNVIDPSLLPTLRQMKFTRNRDAETDIKVGRESLGTKVLSEVASGGGNVPETVSFSGDVYGNVDEVPTTFNIETALDIDLEEGTFTLKPDPDEVKAALIDADRSIAAWLRKELGDITVLETVAI